MTCFPLQVVDVLRAVKHYYGIDLLQDDLICEHFPICLNGIVEEVVLDCFVVDLFSIVCGQALLIVVVAALVHRSKPLVYEFSIEFLAPWIGKRQMLEGIRAKRGYLIPCDAKTWPLLHLEWVIGPEKLKHMVKTVSYISK